MSSGISWADGQKILDLVRQAVTGAVPASSAPQWRPQLGQGGSPGDVVTGPKGSRLSNNTDEYGAYVPTNPGYAAGHIPGDPPGWSPRTYAYGDMAKYGPHNPAVTADQAATLHLVWSIMGIDSSTVGKGTTVDIGPHNQIVGHTKDGKPIWGMPSGDYFNGQLNPLTPQDRENPLGQRVPWGQGIVQEPGMNDVGMNRVAPAPYGYTPEGRPKLNPQDTEGATGISEFAPGRIYGPTLNKYEPTEAESNAQSHDKRMN